ncbi:MAG: macro domain-containing protein, partial [Coriobacteriaceae bacterium]|nr:macro domain-containing protein [Coriobacteriaceae bacterium]
MKSKLARLVTYLIDERNAQQNGPRFEKPTQHATQDELWKLFRALVNTREPIHASQEFYELQDDVLHELIAADGIATCADATPSPLVPHAFLWRGDITRLEVDAIVNAANSQMLGCWVPGHYCIDNAIHTFAGVELREQCAELMQAQGHEEP